MTRVLGLLALTAVVTLAFLAGSWHAPASRDGRAATARRVLYYVDPMHPAYKADKPGIAPDCGMELVPVYEEVGPGGRPEADAAGPAGTVAISGQKQQLIGMRLQRVERVAARQSLRLLGRIAADEARTYRVLAAADGWIQRATPAVTGDVVKRDQPLASFYSLEFLNAQASYLAAINSTDHRLPQISGREGLAGVARDLRVTADRYRHTLRSLGMSEVQIEEVTRTRTPTDEIQLLAPADGVILSRNLSAGQRIEKGTELYRIADLSQVWILVDVFEAEGGHLAPGAVVTARLPGQQRSVTAKVSGALPQFDGVTRTLKVRLVADNPGLRLRPDMFVDIELPVAHAPAIVVPADAVVDSGLRQTVYVESRDGVFEPRGVQTGWRHGDQVEILTGLEAGERIVVSGTFLLDSDSRMKAAAAQAKRSLDRVGSHDAAPAGESQRRDTVQRPVSAGPSDRQASLLGRGPETPAGHAHQQ